jgi:hypothetical protein
MRCAHTSERTSNLLGAFDVGITEVVGLPISASIKGFPPAAMIHLSHCARPSIASRSYVLGFSHSATVLTGRLQRQGLAARSPPRGTAVRSASTSPCLRAQRGRDCLAARQSVRNEMLVKALLQHNPNNLARFMERLLSTRVQEQRQLYRLCKQCNYAA